jgi:hypothetical protein
MTTKKFIDAGSSGEWGWHATELALRCPRLFAYTYRTGQKREETSSPPLLKGSLVHQGLAHHYRRKQEVQQGGDPETWATPEDAIDDCATKLGAHAPQYAALAKDTVARYAMHWANERLEVMAVEEVFGSEIGGWRYTQRLDLVVREADGKVWIYDHKTTGRITRDVATRYTLSGQFIGMHNFGSRVYGDDFGGVKLNMIEVGDNGIGGFKRQMPDPAPGAIRAFPLTVLHARERVAELDRSGIPPEAWPQTLSEQTCVTAYGTCQFFEKCRWS